MLHCAAWRLAPAICDRTILLVRSAVITALLAAFLTGQCAAEEVLTNEVLAGQYSIGGGPNRTDLILSSRGTFAITSRASLGNERQVYGHWHAFGSHVVLRTKRTRQTHRWAFEAVAHRDGYDLVPEETAQIYAENPANIGSRYRRFSKTLTSEPPAGPVVAAQSNPKRVPTSPEAEPTSARAATATADAAGPAVQRQAQSPAPQAIDVKAFVYKPAPADPPDLRKLKSIGRARLQIDARGVVTSAELVESTGHRQFDADALDTFRRWRTKPGEVREVDLPVTGVISGKRVPQRTGTSAGSMTSG